MNPFRFLRTKIVGKFRLLSNSRLTKNASAPPLAAKDTIEEVIVGRAPRADKLCIFAGYDSQGVIHDHVLIHMSALAKEGFEIVYCCTSPKVHGESFRSAASFCSLLIRRRNIGLDFGSWKAAMSADGVSSRDRSALLLTNDSIYGPWKELGSFFERMNKVPESFCGMNDSFEIAHHLQSFFLYYKGSLLRHNAFEQFWNSVNCLEDKSEIITRYEVGQTAFFKSKGIESYSLFSARDILDSVSRQGEDFQYHHELKKGPLNTTLFCWDYLLGEAGYPYLKTEILTKDRFKSRHIMNWEKFVSAGNRELLDAVKNHADEMKKKSSFQNIGGQ